MLIVIFDGEVKKNLLKIENFCGILQKSDVKEVRHSNVPVAQLDRVLASDAKGRGFESLRVRHKMRSLVGLFFVALRTYSQTSGESISALLIGQ